jgi:pimeloyl-ACP methyl ester carboxylesterase
MLAILERQRAMVSKLAGARYRQVIKVSAQTAFSLLERAHFPSALKLAFRLYDTVRRGQPSGLERTALSTAHHSTLNYEGIDVPLYEWNSNGSCTVLFLHGWSGYAGQVTAMLDAMVKADCRVLAFDAPGHGSAGGKTTNVTQYARCVQEVVSSYGPVDVLVGHSFGGLVASYSLLTLSPPVAGAVLISSVFDPDTLLSGFRALTGFSRRITDEIVARTERTAGGRWADRSGERVVPCHNVPALIVHDEADQEVPFSEASRYLEHWRGASAHFTRGLGHRRILYSKDVARAIAQFARNLAGKARGASNNVTLGLESASSS